MESIPKKGGPIILIGAVLLTAAVAVFGVLAGPVSAGDVDNETCIACHDDLGETFAMTAHGTYFSNRPAMSEYGCESCHGSGTEHIDDPSVENILNPARADQFGSSLLCMQCHDNDQFDDWQFSHHNSADVNCASCHQVHTTDAKILKKSSPELCYDCHSSVRAASYMPSHHPIQEGKISCQDCHNVHGGQTSLTMDRSGRELCFSCHADKEGPWVYEHAPVTEDCMICHTPHGSVADKLLKLSEPAAVSQLSRDALPRHFGVGSGRFRDAAGA